jgi:hypothetical protein
MAIAGLAPSFAIKGWSSIPRRFAVWCASMTCSPKRRRRFVATTDSGHDDPIFPDLARDRIIDGPNQLLGGGYHLHRQASIEVWISGQKNGVLQ